MAADSQMWEAFKGHLELMVTKRQDELAPYEAGTQFVSRIANGERVDITGARIDHIKREIASLQRTLDMIRKDHA